MNMMDRINKMNNINKMKYVMNHINKMPSMNRMKSMNKMIKMNKTNKTNKTNKINKLNKTSKTNKIIRMNRMNRMNRDNVVWKVWQFWQAVLAIYPVHMFYLFACVSHLYLSYPCISMVHAGYCWQHARWGVKKICMVEMSMLSVVKQELAIWPGKKINGYWYGNLKPTILLSKTLSLTHWAGAQPGGIMVWAKIKHAASTGANFHLSSRIMQTCISLWVSVPVTLNSVHHSAWEIYYILELASNQQDASSTHGRKTCKEIMELLLVAVCFNQSRSWFFIMHGFLSSLFPM